MLIWIFEVVLVFGVGLSKVAKKFTSNIGLETENRQCILCVNILHVFHFMFTFLAEAWGHSSYIVHNVVYKLDTNLLKNNLHNLLRWQHSKLLELMLTHAGDDQI